MFGHRHDGKLLKKIDPIIALTPYIMPMRCDAQVFLDLKFSFDKMSRYITEKNAEGHHLSFMMIIMAAYARVVSQIPAVNRFIANKRIYARTELTVSFALLQDTGDGSISENTVKIWFDPTDTIFDVEKRVQKIIDEARKVEADNSTMKVAKLLLHPILANPIVALARFLDRYGLMPNYILNASPFHTSLFVTNVSSIGLPAVKHHIYNFGTTSAFLSMGLPERKTSVKNGQTVRERFMPIGVTVDERIAEGAVYAKLQQMMVYYTGHPEELELPPEKVYFEENNEYHCPKPE